MRAAVLQKFLVGGIALVVGAIAADPLLAVPAGIAIAAVVSMAVWPASMEIVGNVATVAVVASFIWLALRRRRPATPPATAAPSSTSIPTAPSQEPADARTSPLRR